MLLPILACLFNCAPPLVAIVEVHGKSPPALGVDMMLVPADPRIPLTDPVYLYLSRIVTRALADKGLKPASEAGDGRVLVSIGWERDVPKTVLSAAPTLQSGNFRGEPPGLHPGTLRGLAGTGSLADLGTPNDPIDKAIKTTVYPWAIELKWLDAAGAVAAPLWTVTANGDSASDDAAEAAPELVVAATRFIGAPGLHKDIRVSASDPAVKSLVANIAKAPRQAAARER